MRYVIIGGSAAAVSAVEAIRLVDKASSIALFSDETTPLFSRVLLPYYIAEELPKSMLNFRLADFFQQNSVTAHLGVRVEKIFPESKMVQTANGDQYTYDKLLIATGGKPIVPAVPGVEKKGISTLKTMEDAERIYQMKGTRAVVIGAGSIGVESAISLKRRGIKVTLLEMLDHILPTAFDEEAASIIKARIEDLGIEILTGEKAVRFSGNGRVQSVITDTREIPCDMVVLSVGVKPAIELAVEIGAKIGSNGGIKTDSYMKTSIPDIYAAGDVAETYDIARGIPYINAIWPCAFEQGTLAGLNMAGKETSYEGSFRRNSIGNFIGIPAISMGLTHAGACTDEAEGNRFQEIKKRKKNTYRKLILRNGVIVGAILVGQTQKAGILTTLLKKRIDVSDYIPVLMSDNLNFLDILPLLRRNAEKFREPEYKEIMDTGL